MQLTIKITPKHLRHKKNKQIRRSVKLRDILLNLLVYFINHVYTINQALIVLSSCGENRVIVTYRIISR